MTRADFHAIAAVMRAKKPADPAGEKAWREVVKEFTRRFLVLYPAYDANAFEEACGYWDD